LSLFNELKRRNVIRVGVLYLVAAWLLLQLTDVLSSLLPVPESTGSLVILLLMLGFFPVLIFAWVYEMTPEGLKREVNIDRSHSVTPDTGKKINTLIIVLLVLAIAGLVADRLIPESSRDTDVATADPISAPVATDARSIAVLPFADLSRDQDQQYFTDGLSEELLNLLVRVDDLQVASRTSSFAYRGSSLSIPEISQALKVAHVLEGSVRKDGDRIRITAQLIESGSDRHLWSENFDRELVDIFAIQDEIANAIVLALTGELGIDGGKLVTVESATENFDAYELYLTARELFIKREQLPESIRLFRKAIELDPDFARAWEGLAAVESIAEYWIFDDDIDHYPLAKEAAEKALSLNPNLSMPLAVLGNVDIDLGRRLDYFDEAIQKDPKNTSAHLWRGMELRNVGFFDEAIESFRQCLAIDPGYLNCKHHVAVTYLTMGDTDTALKLYNELIENLYYTTPHVFVSAYVRSGNRELALVLADKAFGNDGAPVIEWIRAIENPEDDHSVGLARLKDWERRTDTGIQLTYVPQVLMTFGAYDDYVSDTAEGALWHPDGDEFRKTQRFKELIRLSGALEYWQKKGFPAHCQPVGDDDFECGRL
jgi:TolB-like protein